MPQTTIVRPSAPHGHAASVSPHPGLASSNACLDEGGWVAGTCSDCFEDQGGRGHQWLRRVKEKLDPEGFVSFTARWAVRNRTRVNFTEYELGTWYLDFWAKNSRIHAGSRYRDRELLVVVTCAE